MSPRSRPSSCPGLARGPLGILGAAALIGAGLTGGYLGHRASNAYAGTYATSQSLLRPRIAPTCTDGATQVSDDTALQAAIAAANASPTDDTVVCVAQSFQLSQELLITNTTVTLEGRDDSAVTLTAPATATAPRERRHLLVNLTGSDNDTFTLQNLALTGGNVAGGGGGAINFVGETGDRIHLIDDSFVGNRSATDDTATPFKGGAAVIVFLGPEDDTQVFFTRTTWIDNYSEAGGGAAYLNFDDTYAGSIDITGGSFRSNEAKNDGGSLYVESGRGSTDLLSLNGVSFSDDSAGALGGSIWSRIPVRSQGSTFTNNQAASGGAIALSGTGPGTTSISLNDDTFANNLARSGVGGAIVSGATTATDSTFTGNSASSTGGAISASSVELSNSSFYANTSSVQGGAVFATGTLESTDDTFASNSARNSGGAIYAIGLVTLTDSVFRDDSAGISGGAVFTTGDIAVSGGLFEDDTANEFGGAIAGTNVTVHDTTFINNVGNRRGGAIEATGAARIYNSTFTENTAPGGSPSLGRGGAIYASSFYAEYSTFMGNHARDLGGAARADDTVAVSNSTFYRNVAGGAGGSVFADDTGAPVTFAFVTAVDDSSPLGSFLKSYLPAISFVGTVIAPARPNACSIPSPAATAVASRNSFVSDSSCSGGGVPSEYINTQFTTDDSLGLAAALTTDDTPGMQVIVPSATTPLINAAPSNLVTGVDEDQLGASREASSGLTTVGAVQRGVLGFATQPQSQTLQPGQTAVFAVTPNPGVGPLGLRWQVSTDDSTWQSVPGATTPTFTIPNVNLAQSGTRLRVVVTQIMNFTNAPSSTVTSHAATLTVANPAPGPGPGPTPVLPTSPRDVRATAGDARAIVTWRAPETSGGSPITSYQVVNDVDSASCTVPVASAAALECAVTGLKNGSTYRFRVRAVSAAGFGPWSDWSAPVTPEAPPAPQSIVITGSREGRLVTVRGTTTGLAGERVQAMIRFPGQTSFRPGVLRLVNEQGRFTWQRQSGKRIFVYFMHDDISSNRVIVDRRT